jgi:hypothetical protein
MFLGYMIYGRQGTLKTDVEGPELDDYTIDVGSLNNHYYYVAQGDSSLFIVIYILYLCKQVNQDLLMCECSRREYQTLGRIRIHHKRTSELHSLIVMGLAWSPVKQRKTVMLLIVSPIRKVMRCVHLTSPDLSPF